MKEPVPSTMFTSSTMLGRFYGQGDKDECMFDVITDTDDLPVISIRIRPHGHELRIPPGTNLLVQLFERPDVLWLARATAIQGYPTILYAPVEPLESTDGRYQMPALAECSLWQVDEAVHDAMASRDRTKG